jgi:hypothetical protein
MQQTHPAQLKDVFRSAPTDSNHVKFPYFGAELSIGGHYSTNSMNLSTQKPGMDTSMRWSLRTPGQHRPIVVSQWKG